MNASQTEQSDNDEVTNETVPNDDEMETAEDEEDQMPHLDLVEPQVILSVGHEEEDDDDDDPNGAGEQYLDAKDKEFVPKRIIPKSARKSFSFSPNNIQILPKRRKFKNKGLLLKGFLKF